MKKVTLILMINFIIIMFCACSGINKTPDENKILSDYISQSADTAYANFTKVDIIRNQLNKNEKNFIADIRLTGKDDYADYTSTASIVYNFYDDRGWMLDEIKNVKIDYKCYAGRTLEEIETDVKRNYTSYLPGGLWVDNFALEQLLEQNMQIVTFDCEILKKHLITRYEELKMYFKYDRGIWVMEKIEKIPVNFSINLDGTYWKTDNYEDKNIRILEISEDSRKITFECNGVKYTGTLSSEYKESTFEKYRVSYKLDNSKQIYLYSILGTEVDPVTNLDIYNLTNNEDVRLSISTAKNWGGFAVYDLVSDPPVPGVRVYYED